jgi:hypothetical protein
VLRHRRLLQVGNDVWPGEYYPGYPVRVMLSNHYHMVTAYGQTAAARRQSRVELWDRQAQIVHGMIDPMVEGKWLYLCCTSPRAAQRWLGDTALDKFTAGLQAHPGMDGAALRRFAAGWPAGQNHPRACLALQGGGSAPQDARPIEHGLSLRLRVPFQKARLTDLRLNGYPLPPSEVDGYMTWVARGYTYVQVNIPPKRSAKENLFVVTCRYEPGEKRARWRGWES